MDEQRLILIVEDDEATRAFLAEHIAADGPSLVLLDLALEAGSGLDLPVIVLTGRVGGADRVRSFARGAELVRARATSPTPAAPRLRGPVGNRSRSKPESPCHS
jgi:CheY-like chemotaxis protein